MTLKKGYIKEIHRKIMHDWQRVIEERCRIQGLIRVEFDKNLDHNKIVKRRCDEEKRVAVDSGGRLLLEGICYWILCDNFVVSAC